MIRDQVPAPDVHRGHLDYVQEIMRDVYAVGGATASVLHQYMKQEDRPYLTASRPAFVSG